MYLTRHASDDGPRWAIDGTYADPGFTLSGLLALAALLAAFSVEWAPVAALYLLAILTTITVGQRIYAVAQVLQRETA